MNHRTYTHAIEFIDNTTDGTDTWPKVGEKLT